MITMTEYRRGLVDARGRVYPFRTLAVKLADTLVKTLLLVAIAAAVPFVAAGMRPDDALFESMSGLTTTGATTMRDFSAFGRAIFFWRAFSHWLGGMGVIALFVAVLPRLSIGGRQLFFAEAPGPTDEKLTPQIRKTAAALWTVYAGLTRTASFHRAESRFVAQNQVVTIQSGVLESERTRVDFRGTVTFAQVADLTMDLVFSGSAGDRLAPLIANKTIPLRVRGPLDRPQVVPNVDAAALARAAAGRLVPDRLRDLLGR